MNPILLIYPTNVKMETPLLIDYKRKQFESPATSSSFEAMNTCTLCSRIPAISRRRIGRGSVAARGLRPEASSLKGRLKLAGAKPSSSRERFTSQMPADHDVNIATMND